jgi:hypothetical protein
VTVRGHERMVTDGPYAESKDLVTGSMIIEADSLEDAVEVARTCPTFEFVGSVEVRPVQDYGGKRLFADGFDTASLELVDVRTLSTGVVILTHRPAR